ncbi:MAG: KTSC domain-containing protein [Verrucomicrobiaceae bacterium]|nr:MAG: KTSC domain-containing protein [Verrucomicrobiaceae bacterium]
MTFFVEPNLFVESYTREIQMSFTKTNGTDFNSGNIDGYTYDASAQTLEVGFIGGKTYRYTGVDSSTASNFDSAESKTKFLNESIKNRFEFETL